MRFSKNFPNEIINHFDLLNTISGGVSMTSVNVLVQDNQFIIKVHTPGLNRFAYHVEVINNMVFIYSLLSLGKSEEEIQVPSFVKYIPLPNNANAEEIHAVHEDGELKVIVPVNTQQNHKQRKINIEYL
ncbi:MAG: Hsp20 family protein [Bacteroidota bacterium]|nr:Hsp20 family protein [Bacteroidota bacterium]